MSVSSGLDRFSFGWTEGNGCQVFAAGWLEQEIDAGCKLFPVGWTTENGCDVFYVGWLDGTAVPSVEPDCGCVLFTTGWVAVPGQEPGCELFTVGWLCGPAIPPVVPPDDLTGLGSGHVINQRIMADDAEVATAVITAFLELQRCNRTCDDDGTKRLH